MPPWRQPALRSAFFDEDEDPPPESVMPVTSSRVSS